MNDTTDDIQTLRQIYRCFNARDIPGVLAHLTQDVLWANAMQGGHAHGHAAISEYWTHQWSLVSPHVDPLSFARSADGAITVQVQQTIRDLAGNLLQDQTQPLRDQRVTHIFQFQAGKVTRFDVQGAT